MRNQRGFTLIFAVILCVVFAGLLSSIYYFLRMNVSKSASSIYEQQAKYLAESGNNRAMTMLNTKHYPESEVGFVNANGDLVNLDGELIDSEGNVIGGDDEDDFFDDDWDDEDFDEFFDEDEFFDDDDWDEWDDDDDEDEDEDAFLLKIPRFSNFYSKNLYYVNIDTGQVVTEAVYFSLVQAQQAEIQSNKAQAQQNGYAYTQNTILIEELYFPLPEVNVRNIGMIPIKKGVHLKPGFKIQLAQKIPVELKRDSIVDEYFNYVPDYQISTPKPVLRNMAPNYASQGEYLNIYFEGENIDDVVPLFSSQDITVFESSGTNASIGITEKAKPGKYQVQFGKYKTDFFIVPLTDGSPAPIITEVRLPQMVEGNNQFIKITDKEKLKGLKIMGENLVVGDEKPLLVPDAFGIDVEVVSYSPNEIVINVSTDRPSLGAHYFSIFTKGGQSGSWIFNVEKGEEEIPETPDTGSFSTLLTLLEVNSLSNLPFSMVVGGSSTGRPQAAPAGGRPGQGNKPNANQSKNSKKFDLLRSDLEMVWKVETVATVNKISFKETRIVSRTVPNIEAALTTTTDVSFGQSSVILEGLLEASTILEESSTSGDTIIYVAGADPYQDDTKSRDNGTPLVPTGSAVVENFNFSTDEYSPAAKGFKAGGLISILSSRGGEVYSDTAFVESTDERSITVKAPGFKSGHYVGDQIVQFKPSVIGPEEISEREAERSLDPPGSYVNLPGKTNFDYVFRTNLDKMLEWADATDDTSVPSDLKTDVDGYFGLNIIKGTPSYTGGNSLYGQGTLIIDTTEDGYNPTGSTVTIGGSSKLPSIFEGVIYILGNLQISGPVEISGGIVVHSPLDNATIRISGSGNISYNEKAVQKSIIHLPYTEELRTRVMERSKGQQEILQKDKK